MEKPVIMVVDDDEDLRKDVANFLKEVYSSHEVIVCKNGELALEATKKCGWRTEFAITDVEMPGMHGGEFTERVKKLYPEIKVMMISGMRRPNLAELAKKSGADAFLGKPFKLKWLQEDIQKLLS